MRIKYIKLSWFRGASELADLDLNSGSIVIYGENGSGKSSFVDAVEYVIQGGKIKHLAHEYSGKRQEKAVVNTHIPQGKKAEIEIEFQNGSKAYTKIEKDGYNTSSGIDDISQWDYHRTILRQNEVSDFISYTKGDKYSALLPLFGLGSLEVTAENLRQLEKQVEQESFFSEKQRQINLIKEARQKNFDEADDVSIKGKLKNLYEKYFQDAFEEKDLLNACDKINVILQEKIDNNSANYALYKTLLDISQLDIVGNITSVRTESLKLANEVEPHILEKLAVLEAASSYAQKLDTESLINCPACGYKISSKSFQDHITKEKKSLEEIISVFNERKITIEKMCDDLNAAKKNLEKTEVKTRIGISYKENLSYLNSLNINTLRVSCSEAELIEITEKIIPIIEEAKNAVKKAPPDIKEILKEQNLNNAIGEVFKSKTLEGEVKKIGDLVSFIAEVQKKIRGEIRVQSQRVIVEITDDIQRMWGILHPKEKIEGIHLYTPLEADKAIEIGLRFYGMEQDSPRLTLSEGHRNSLGLCIFLAMAKREEKSDRPLFLDDVVVSIDGNHRGMILPLLEKEFAKRQVIILTHDREWFIELRQQTRSADWKFKALMPWDDPEIGIRWSERVPSLDDARALLKDDPSAAGNRARAYMDIELAFYAQELKVRMPYLFREKNDHRMAHEFLERIIADARKCFEIKDGNNYRIFAEAINKLEKADRLLVSWGNRASHGKLTKAEAEKLIDTCEEALNCFVCPSCKKLVSKNEDSSSEIRQCECGTLRWCYGKI